MAPLEGVIALTFDVFGTVVNWHESVASELAAKAKFSSVPEVRSMSAEGKPFLTRERQSIFYGLADNPFGLPGVSPAQNGGNSRKNGELDI